MMTKPKYRHELKYEITYGEYRILKSRLLSVMKYDPHALANGTYQINSLYYDNYNDKALNEKLDGIQNRDKYRIRYYNNDYEMLSLEKKSKRNDLCLKKSCLITEKECEYLVRGDFDRISTDEMRGDRELIREYQREWEYGQLRPRTIVAYKRCPLIYVPGNVRVTFDMDIRSGLFNTDFPCTDTLMMPVFPGRMVLEVKFDEYLPDIIRLLLQSGIPRVGAFSKYAACRKYEIS